MTELTDFDKVINSQTVNITIATDTVAGVQIVRAKNTNPVTRFNTRGVPVDAYASNLTDYVVTAMVTDALRSKLITYTTLSARFVPPTVACVLVGLTTGGASDVSVAFNARLYDLASEALQTGLWMVTYTMRVKV